MVGISTGDLPGASWMQCRTAAFGRPAKERLEVSWSGAQDVEGRLMLNESDYVMHVTSNVLKPVICGSLRSLGFVAWRREAGKVICWELQWPRRWIHIMILTAT